MFMLCVLFTETSDIFACDWFEFPFHRRLSKACWIWERHLLNADVFLETCLAVKIVLTIRSHSRSPSSQRLWKRAGGSGESKDLLSFGTSHRSHSEWSGIWGKWITTYYLTIAIIDGHRSAWYIQCHLLCDNVTG